MSSVNRFAVGGCQCGHDYWGCIGLPDDLHYTDGNITGLILHYTNPVFLYGSYSGWVGSFSQGGFCYYVAFLSALSGYYIPVIAFYRVSGACDPAHWDNSGYFWVEDGVLPTTCSPFLMTWTTPSHWGLTPSTYTITT